MYKTQTYGAIIGTVLLGLVTITWNLFILNMATIAVHMLGFFLEYVREKVLAETQVGGCQCCPSVRLQFTSKLTKF